MNYPSAIKKNKTQVITYGNRGMDLEGLLNESNQYYLFNDIALIYKKPTDIGIAKVNYQNSQKRIQDGYFKSPSTLDYNGIYREKYIEFEAKETKSTTAFPLKNVHEHQIVHLRKVIEHGGIAFLIIKIASEYYLLKGTDFLAFLENNERKSIPLSYLKENGYAMKEQIDPPLDYLKIVNKIYFGGHENEK